MSGMKRIAVYTLLFTFLWYYTLVLYTHHGDDSQFSAHAEKEEWYTSFEEFLPVVEGETQEGEVVDVQYLEQNGYVTAAKIKGIKIRKDDNTMLFILTPESGKRIDEKDLFYEIHAVGFPSRIIVRLYGVRNEDRTFRFFKNIEILGVVSNPFTHSWVTEYVIFFDDWVVASGEYSKEQAELRMKYDFTLPEFHQGFGVRIADTRIDPLPQVIEVMRTLTQFGLDNYLLVAQDQETVVLESPFYPTKEEAIQYIESLERFGYKGKLAIRRYNDFPVPHRFDVVSDVVITGEDDTNLRNIVEREWKPERIYALSYQEIHTISMGYFSPKVRSDDDLISEYYYNLSELYRSYHTDDDAIRERAQLVAIKALEIIYFMYPKSKRAPDALWDIANIIRDHAVVDMLGEEDCYRTILQEYPESLFAEEAGARIDNMEEQDTGATVKE
jgi:hypothetical protein